MPSQFLHQLCVSYPTRNGAREKIVHLRLSWIELIHQSLNRALAYLPHPASQTLVVMYSSATMCGRGFFKEILIKSHLQASFDIGNTWCTNATKYERPTKITFFNDIVIWYKFSKCETFSQDWFFDQYFWYHPKLVHMCCLLFARIYKDNFI